MVWCGDFHCVQVVWQRVFFDCLQAASCYPARKTSARWEEFLFFVGNGYLYGYCTSAVGLCELSEKWKGKGDKWSYNKELTQRK